MKEKPFQDV